MMRSGEQSVMIGMRIGMCVWENGNLRMKNGRLGTKIAMCMGEYKCGYGIWWIRDANISYEL